MARATSTTAEAPTRTERTSTRAAGGTEAPRTRAGRGTTAGKGGTALPKTFVGTVGEAISVRRREIGLTLAVASGGFALLALAGFSVEDPTWLSPDVTGARTLANWTGPLGANVADLLYRAVGWGAWPLALGFVVVPVLKLAGRTVGPFAKWMVGLWLYAMLLATAQLLFGEGTLGPMRPGGRLGAIVSTSLVDVVGVAGAAVVLLATLTTAGSVLANVSWSRVAGGLVRGVERQLPAAQQGVVAVGGAVGGLTRDGAVGAGRLSLGLLVRIGQLVIEGFRKLGRGLSGSVARARSAITRPGLDELDDRAWSDLTGLERPEAGDRSLLDVTEIPDASKVGTDADAPVAEARWRRTDPGPVPDHDALFSALTPRDATDVDGRPTPVRVERARDPEPAPRPAPRIAVARPAPEAEVLEAPPVSALRAYQPPAPKVVKAPPVVVPLDEDDADDLDDEEDLDEEDELDALGEVPSTGSRERRELEIEPAEGLQVGPARDDGAQVSDHGSLYFELPALSLLDVVPEQHARIDEDDLKALAHTVEESLASFKVTGQVTNVRVGPVVTIFEFLPDPGIKVRRIASLADDLAMALKAPSVRVVAPIPGKGVVGIEVPSRNRLSIYLRELLASPEFRKSEADLPVALGKDTEGRPVVEDLTKMPHLLVGGTTGSGKSVGVNGMLLSLLYTRTPEELRLLLVDPKKLEFEAYNGVPHLLHPVVTDAQGAAAALAWACREMDRRYELLSRWQTRSIGSYNKKVEREMKGWNREKALRFAGPDWPHDVPPPKPELLPFIVVVIDELADLMMTAKKEVQDSIVRLAQMARACGIHLIVATQRPSVDVVTGLIKSNLPTRISFKLRSVVDSRTILDQGGAEKLLGRGDMLVLTGGSEPRRVHGAFVGDDEVVRVIDFLRAQREPQYVDDITRPTAGSSDDPDAEFSDPELDDALYQEALDFVMDKGKASTSMVQRKFKIGYNRAARLIDAMEAAGAVGAADGARPREVLVGPHAR